jgi:membrane-associated protein
MLDPAFIIKTAGLLGIFLIVFAESGLFFGFFLPGDTLLFASGIFALQGLFSISAVILTCALGAIAGGMIGYWSGATMGRRLFERKSSFFFNKDRIYDVERFYTKHGPITILIARFIPFARTFSPIVAGVGKMKYRSFTFFNIIGGIVWATIVPLAGFYLGAFIPNPDRFLLPVALLVVGISFVPFILKLLHHFVFRRK